MKILRIRKCEDCPYRDKGGSALDYCEKSKKHILESKHIINNSNFPFWCLLKDYMVREVKQRMKIIKVEDCIECPFCESDNINKSWLCMFTHRSKFISYITQIENDVPSWCPLEDYKEADHD